ncbi:amidohydrolase family protein [Azospirillum lipoferum]|uniref:Aminohydrolase n=1 Tax=Azospirillum lipoferum (strain 4B) TaxID=862719 RepID=G7ZD86_AZOL4|nr:amidohydrolase family protein [Azospirillum lipoferum]CBS89365.1 putative aminohydrolase [Azospirillum lipoferum 4B]
MTAHPLIGGIDTHAHIFRPDLPMAAGRRYSPAHAAELSDWFALQDKAGFSHGVLIQPSFLGTDNSFIEAALCAHPERLRAVAVVDPGVTEEELDRLGALGFVGARLNLVGREVEDYAAPPWPEFFRRLAARRWQVEIQRRFDDLADLVPAIADTGVTVVIDHFGLPQGGIDPGNRSHRAFLDQLRRMPDVWVKLSAPYRAGLTPDLAARSFELLREACGGSNRFVWGSDWPHTQHEAETGYAAQLARLHDLIPDPDERARILVRNPATLFQFA